MKLLKEHLAVLCRIAEEAGMAIMAIYEGEFDVISKSDDSPLTLADLRADQIIRARLTESFPGIPVVSEESKSAVQVTDNPVTFFLVDPLDGTKEFVNRNSEFTVNIALIHAERPIAGVVYAPALSVMYFASDELGAWRRTSTTDPIKVAVRDHSHPLRVIGSRSHAGPEMETWLAALRCEYSLVTAGSSLKFCKVAEGAADIYPRLTPTCQWDTAAAQCILQNAGGAVIDSTGAPLSYGLSKPMLNPGFFATGDANINRARADD